ncbi:hypothetical protein H920_11312 [Fukomys damarensis]|uniref:Uncharacterized protein n=1 Tax=Fukomys damarensis TaxID=885580 RepID=A0A091D5A9_FUKDA|nr:hypothetical protein H920_11312 [Fukomys damarensis]
MTVFSSKMQNDKRSGRMVCGELDVCKDGKHYLEEAALRVRMNGPGEEEQKEAQAEELMQNPCSGTKEASTRNPERASVVATQWNMVGQLMRSLPFENIGKP